ncbi:MAG: hypothetical protein SNJ72_05685 [Fimbriimonadales bacterium]
MTKGWIIGALSALMVAGANAQLAQELERGEYFSWIFNGGRYEIRGGLTLDGTVNASDPVAFYFTDVNNDGLVLDITLDIGQLLPDIGLNVTADLVASVVSDDGTTAVIDWTGEIFPNACIQVTQPIQTQILVTRVYGRIRGRVTRIACGPDPLGALSQNVHLKVEMEGGNAYNELGLEGYLFCFQSPFSFTTARITDASWIGYGGGLPLSLGNVNGDCTIDDADLLQVLFSFGSDDPGSDTNNDGTVDDADLLTVLFNFGLSV